ncbi:MAG: TonB-dependent receptor [Emcibacter sp.]|nr:TonB-dependent receptor [Emcibacter sp.]
MSFIRGLIGTVSVVALQSTFSVAQAEDAAVKKSFELEEIIVTAKKRSQNLQDVAMGITAFSGVEMERAGDVTFEDFAVRVPNLTFAYSGDGGLQSRSIAVRGIFGGGTTGFYIDDTPMQESMAPVVLDLERVEVLRGPQGTLYGARSMGGTVRFITKQPNLNEMEVKGHMGASNTKEGGWNYQIDAAVNLPVVKDKMAVRLVGYYQYQEGIFDREHADYTPIPGVPVVFPTADFASTENIDDYDVRGVQAAVKFQATDSLTINGRINYQKAGVDSLPFADHEPGNYTNVRAFNVNEFSEDEWYHASIGFNADLGSGSLVGNFSHWDRDTHDAEDVSELMSWFGFFAGVPAFMPPVAAVNDRVGEVKGDVAEIRFVSDFDSPFQVVVGGFYSNTKFKNDMLQTGEGLSDAVDTLLFGVPAGSGFDILGINDTGFSQIFRGQIKEVAMFGEASYELTEKLKVTAGVRWFETKINSDGEIGGFVGLDPTSAVEPSFAKENGFNPKFSVEYSYSDDGLVYATAAKGFRRGGVNAAPLGFCGDALEDVGFTDTTEAKSYKSDTIWSYEIGAKTTLADNRVKLNGAAYWIDWSDMQQNITLACGFGLTVNSGKAVSKGFEVETSIAVAEGFIVDASVGYTDAKVTESGLSQSLISVPGTRVQHIPKWTFSTSAEYEFALSDNMDGRLRADYSYISDSMSYINIPNPESQAVSAQRPAVNLLNLRATAVLENWELSLFADNLLNEITSFGDSRSLSVETPGRPRMHQNRPRTIGLEARFSF